MQVGQTVYYFTDTICADTIDVVDNENSEARLSHYGWTAFRNISETPDELAQKRHDLLLRDQTSLRRHIREFHETLRRTNADVERGPQKFSEQEIAAAHDRLAQETAAKKSWGIAKAVQQPSNPPDPAAQVFGNDSASIMIIPAPRNDNDAVAAAIANTTFRN